MDSKSKLIVPEQPSQVTSEQLHVYVPVAGPNEEIGVAKFDKNVFTVDNNGKVTLEESKLPGTIVKNVYVDYDKGVIRFEYNGHNPSKEISIPYISSDFKVIKSNILNILEFKKSDWIKVDCSDHEHSGDVHYHLVISPLQVGFNNPNYVAFAEDRLDGTAGNEPKTTDEHCYYDTHKQYGYVTTVNSFFKCDDGTLVYSIDTEPYNGRILILAGWLFDENKLSNLTYDEATSVLKLQYADGTNKSLSVPTTDGILLSDLQLGKGEFPEEAQDGANVPTEYQNYKLKLFAPTANTSHGDSQWSVIDIDNPGIGNHKLKIGITGGNTRYGQIEYYQGSGSDTTKMQFTPDGVSVSSPKAEVLSAARDGVGKVFQGFAYGSQTVAQIKAIWNDGGSGGLLIKKDGLYQASSSNDNEGIKLATVNDISGGGSKMYKHTLYFRVNATYDDYPHTGDWEGVYSFTKSIFNDSATKLTYQQAIEYIGNIFTINNLGQYHIDSMRDNWQDCQWQGYNCTRCDSSGYDKVLIMFMRNGFVDTVTEV